MPTPRLSVRSGASLTFRVNWWPPGVRSERIDSTNYTAKLEIARLVPRRTFVQASEWRGEGVPPANTLIRFLQPGEWEVRLGKTITSSLPTHTVLGIELVNQHDPEDVVDLMNAQLVVSPEVVTRVSLAD